MWEKGFIVENNTSGRNIVEKEMVSYIQQNFTGKISLREFGEQFHLSEKYISRYFKEHFHITLSQYVAYLRLEYAKQLLQDTDISVTEVAMRSGYQNISYFIRSFKKTYGISPLKYRNSGILTKIQLSTILHTNDKNYLLNEWIRISGNNYGFYIYAHGNSSGFTLENGNSSKFVSSSDISGNWHLVFLDSCSCLATDTFGRAFKTLGYSNRATLGWYMDIAHVASEEWWTHFYPVAGTTNIRSACLTAADQSQNKTPIRMYGDTSWYGWAW